MNNLIIDVYTKSARKIYNRLKRLKSTIEIDEPAAYLACPECSQIVITSTKAEEDLDHYLWSNNLDYIGVTEK